MNETTKNILSFDPIAAAESVIGKRHEDWDLEIDSTTALGIALLTNAFKKDHLKSISDTHFNISWQDFIDIAKSYGFECSLRQKFTAKTFSNENVEEEEIIFFHKEKGLILYAESYDGSSVNSAKIYGEVKVSGKKLEENQWDALSGCSYCGNENGTISFNIDVREGLIFHLDAVSEAFEFSKSWSNVQFLWFLNYMDTKKEDYSRKEINNQKIDACTPDVRKIIFG